MKFKKTTNSFTGNTLWKGTHSDSSWRSGMIDDRLPYVELVPQVSRFAYSVKSSQGVDLGCFDTLPEAKALVRSYSRDMGYI